MMKHASFFSSLTRCNTWSSHQSIDYTRPSTKKDFMRAKKEMENDGESESKREERVEEMKRNSRVNLVTSWNVVSSTSWERWRFFSSGLLLSLSFSLTSPHLFIHPLLLLLLSSPFKQDVTRPKTGSKPLREKKFSDLTFPCTFPSEKKETRNTNWCNSRPTPLLCFRLWSLFLSLYSQITSLFSTNSSFSLPLSPPPSFPNPNSFPSLQEPNFVFKSLLPFCWSLHT